MKRLQVFVALLAILAFVAHPGFVFAQRPDREAMMTSAAKKAFKELLTEADKNHDGKFSRTEFLEIFKDKEKAEKNFKTWDLNKDGFITEEEYVQAVVNITGPRKG